MLGPTDIQRLATMIDPEKEGMIEATSEEIDISHLDYAYVRSTSDKAELVRLLDYLRSGKEGYYPDLEACMISRLSELDPVAHPIPLTNRQKYEAKESVAADLQEWETSFKQSADDSEKIEFDNRPVRSSTTVEVNSNSYSKPSIASRNNPDRIKSNDYRAWDKFDIEQELEKIDNTETRSLPAVINSQEKHAPIPSSLTEKQRIFNAENEKNKGNECLKSQEYDQAIYHYNTSLKLMPSVAVYNNRALANLKLKNYSKCVSDCSKSLDMEVTFKALLRRSSAYMSIAKFQNAIVDLDKCLEMKPDSQEAANLREKIVEKWADSDGTAGGSKSKSKLKIEEIEEPIAMSPQYQEYDHSKPKIMEIVDDELPSILELEKLEVSKSSKVAIVEVDDDDSDDD